MNKQIEEMARVLCADCGKTVWCVRAYGAGMCPDVISQAEALYNAGYRKQSEGIANNATTTGEWILHKPRRENRNATYKCSVCGKLCSSYYNDVGAWKFCPHCGAKMKGGGENG
jgi:rubrerythrin